MTRKKIEKASQLHPDTIDRIIAPLKRKDIVAGPLLKNANFDKSLVNKQKK